MAADDNNNYLILNIGEYFCSKFADYFILHSHVEKARADT